MGPQTVRQEQLPLSNSPPSNSEPGEILPCKHDDTRFPRLKRPLYNNCTQHKGHFQSKKRSRSNSPDASLLRMKNYKSHSAPKSPPIGVVRRRSGEPSQIIPSTSSLQVSPVENIDTRPPTVEEFISRRNPKIAAWLDIDDPRPPTLVKSYPTYATSDSITMDGTQTTSVKRKGYDLMNERFRSHTLGLNSIEIQENYTKVPEWVQRQLNEIHACPIDDIPSNIHGIHRRYSNVAMEGTYEAEYVEELIKAFDLMRENWIEVRKTKASRDHNNPPGLTASNDGKEIRERKELEQFGTLEHAVSADIEDLEASLPTSLLKYNIRVPFLSENCSLQKWRRPLMIPVPDILFGYKSSRIPEMSDLDERASDVYSCQCFWPNNTNLCFPYMVLEIKGHRDSIIEAENQAIISGRISLDTTWPILGNQDMVFLISTTPYLAHISVMWRDISQATQQPYYKVKFLTGFALMKLEEFKGFRTLLYRIQYWAETNKLQQIQQGLRKWKDERQKLTQRT
ncbi:uncharacterized protein F4817DRAFT_369588 [Daldinia loculata]|uniref:uncharacterized protein n=1 Tax=Daldinia loculata TaxID=103429 RepID=UPI0020C2C96C|nr:uncharacterized protein F4817DRAFT_369588 [Daldinia loculata]KAI1642262.1 hypothetical protein F4817DRAFT_369588 [Daldinia loculata]